MKRFEMLPSRQSPRALSLSTADSHRLADRLKEREGNSIV